MPAVRGATADWTMSDMHVVVVTIHVTVPDNLVSEAMIHLPILYSLAKTSLVWTHLVVPEIGFGTGIDNFATSTPTGNVFRDFSRTGFTTEAFGLSDLTQGVKDVVDFVIERSVGMSTLESDMLCVQAFVNRLRVPKQSDSTFCSSKRRFSWINLISRSQFGWHDRKQDTTSESEILGNTHSDSRGPYTVCRTSKCVDDMLRTIFDALPSTSLVCVTRPAPNVLHPQSACLPVSAVICTSAKTFAIMRASGIAHHETRPTPFELIPNMMLDICGIPQCRTGLWDVEKYVSVTLYVDRQLHRKYCRNDSRTLRVFLLQGLLPMRRSYFSMNVSFSHPFSQIHTLSWGELCAARDDDRGVDINVYNVDEDPREITEICLNDANPNFLCASQLWEAMRTHVTDSQISKINTFCHTVACHDTADAHVPHDTADAVAFNSPTDAVAFNSPTDDRALHMGDILTLPDPANAEMVDLMVRAPSSNDNVRNPTASESMSFRHSLPRKGLYKHVARNSSE